MFNIDFLLLLADKIKNSDISQELLRDAYNANEWFDRENVESSLAAIVDGMLTREHLEKFVERYDFKDISKGVTAISGTSDISDLCNTKVALVLAGNIPFVGCADVIYCALCSVDTYIKYASKDSVTMRWFVKLMSECNPLWQVHEYSGERVDKVIATGSNNSNRYFEYNFGNIPSIMRGSRSSIAVITGEESEEDLLNLWDDIFLHYGQGCRNVSMLFVPQGFDRGKLWSAWAGKRVESVHFINIYKQQRALLLMQKDNFYDGGYFTAIDRHSLQAATSQINISEYTSLSSVGSFIEANNNLLQCVVGLDDRCVPFGRAQYPAMWDYADNIDVVDFLLATI